MPNSSSSTQRTAWLLFAPPAALVGFRWLLQWQHDRGVQTPLLPLTPFTPPTGVASVLAPFGWGLLALLTVGFAVRWAAQRWGWRAPAICRGSITMCWRWWALAQ